MKHLILKDADFDAQLRAVLEIIQNDPLLHMVITRVRELQLDECWLVSGAIYNTVWNSLTNRPSGYGIKDIDLFYFDDSNLSYEAEDRVIQAGMDIFSDFTIPVEIRNQARVHLWYEKHFGTPAQPLLSCKDAIYSFAAKTHAVGLRLRQGEAPEIFAPYGLNDIFSFKMTPNPDRDNKKTYQNKAERIQQFWPEVEIIEWPSSGSEYPT